MSIDYIVAKEDYDEYMEIIESQKQEIGKLVDELEEQERHIKEANAEIERLNNIINELEKFICDLEIECNIDSSMWGVAVIIHNKLKELKGDEKK